MTSSDRTRGTVRPEGDLDVGPTGKLEDGQRVLGDLVGLDVPAAAGDGDDLGLARRHRVEEREAVVDAGVAVDEDRDGAVTVRC